MLIDGPGTIISLMRPVVQCEGPRIGHCPELPRWDPPGSVG